MNELEGHFTLGFADGEDAPEKPISLLADGLADAEEFLESHPDTKARFERVANLIAGFETPYGMELLATVHWVATKDGATTLHDVNEAIHAWNTRKRALFSPRHIELAWNVLHQRQLLTNRE